MSSAFSRSTLNTDGANPMSCLAGSRRRNRERETGLVTMCSQEEARQDDRI